ncbi:MAG TPA: hypothetical protein VKU82_07310 [Planctomycetaceae bacterium]|nr:hypothetical protein [Planctomycetaceae bacterium]
MSEIVLNAKPGRLKPELQQRQLEFSLQAAQFDLVVRAGCHGGVSEMWSMPSWAG